MHSERSTTVGLFYFIMCEAPLEAQRHEEREGAVHIDEVKTSCM